MTAEQINAMEAGPEMDRAVAKVPRSCYNALTTRQPQPCG